MHVFEHSGDGILCVFTGRDKNSFSRVLTWPVRTRPQANAGQAAGSCSPQPDGSTQSAGAGLDTGDPLHLGVTPISLLPGKRWLMEASLMEWGEGCL